MLSLSYKAVALAVAVLALLSGVSPAGTPPAEAAQPLQFVALGDSLTQSGGFTARYRDRMQADLGLASQSVNLGTNGSSSGELLDRLITNPAYRTAVAGADVIVIQAGLNDYYRARFRYLSGDCGGEDNQDCMREMVPSFNANWTALLEELLVLADSEEVAIRALNMHYPFFALDNWTGPFAVLNVYLSQMNEHIAAESARLDIPLADVHAAFHGPAGNLDPINGGYLLLDGIHPTDAGNRAIADALRSLGYLPLVPTCPNVNNDNRVNIVDLFLIAKNAGAPVTAESALFDVNGSGHIDIVDLFLAAKKVDMFCG